MGFGSGKAERVPEPRPEVIIPTQHVVSATTLMPSTVDQAYGKMLRQIDERWPGKVFKIQSLSVFPAGNGYTISALIEEQAA